MTKRDPFASGDGKWKPVHGHIRRANGKITRSPTYRSWTGIRTRCLNPNDATYQRYGAKGVTMCERWNKFENFLADMGERPEGKSIDRIDNSKGYEPSNCRWATVQEQSENRAGVRWLEFNGERLTMSGWARKLGFRYPGTIQGRLKNGWTVERALTETPNGR